MRDDAIKKLDDFVNRTCERCEGEYDFDDLRAEWVALRAEFVAERCENCQHASAQIGSGEKSSPKSALLICSFIESFMYRDAFCSHFKKKETT